MLCGRRSNKLKRKSVSLPGNKDGGSRSARRWCEVCKGAGGGSERVREAGQRKESGKVGICVRLGGGGGHGRWLGARVPGGLGEATAARAATPVRACTYAPAPTLAGEKGRLLARRGVQSGSCLAAVVAVKVGCVAWRRSRAARVACVDGLVSAAATWRPPPGSPSNASTPPACCCCPIYSHVYLIPWA